MSHDFAAGQVWKYNHRAGEDNSRITIVKVEEEPDYGEVVHVYISDLAIPNESAPDGITNFICHMPFVAGAVASSVTELESDSTAMPDFEEGYQLWREAFEQEEAGVFEVSVAEGVDFVQQTLSGKSS